MSVDPRELFPEEYCTECGAKLTCDDIGLHKKLVNRGATEFTCIKCLAKRYNVSVARLEEKIKEFKESGCTLFR